MFTFVHVLQAEEMAKTFRQRVAQAEAAARAEELRLQQEVILFLCTINTNCINVSCVA